MARRRFGPLVVAVVVATAVLIGRLAQVQVGEHEVWADEAAALVRVGRVVPYRRGEIRELERFFTTRRNTRSWNEKWSSPAGPRAGSITPART